MTETQGLLIVVSAPSGAGKTSILADLFKNRPDIEFSVSVTTRTPRVDERDGVNYHFVDDAQFDRYIVDDAFAEWAVVHGKRYGTLKSAIDDVLARQGTMILDTDTVGAFNIRKSFPGSILVFIAPPSPEILAERLRRRNTEPDDIIGKRLGAAPAEMARMPEYDYIVMNDSIPEAVSKINAIIDAEKCRTKRIIPTLTAWRDYING